MQEIREHAEEAHCGEASQIIETQPASGGHGKQGYGGNHHD